MTKRYRLELLSLQSGEALGSVNGRYFVCEAGSPKLQAIFDAATGQAVNLTTSPAQAFTNGQIDFNVAATVNSVDVYIYTERGRFVSVHGITPGGTSEVYVDMQRRDQTLILPFHPSDYTQASARNTGILEIPGVVYRVNLSGVRVTTIDATETIDVGNTTDPNGIVAAASVATATTVISAGALGSGATYIGAANEQFNYTLSAGSDTAAGFIFISSLIVA